MKKTAPWVAVVAAALLAGCASAAASHDNGTAGSTLPAVPIVKNSAPPPSCKNYVDLWKMTPGFSAIGIVGAMLGKVSNDSRSSNLAAMHKDLLSAVHQAHLELKNLPPGCIPGMTGNTKIAMDDIISAQRSLAHGSSEVHVATAKVSAARKALALGTRAYDKWLATQH